VSRNQKQTSARTRSRPKGRGGAKRTIPSGPRRWWVVVLALGVVGASGVYLGLRGGYFAAGEAPMDDIGDASRLRIENLLREAESDPGKPQ
jgi:hypothetical protein